MPVRVSATDRIRTKIDALFAEARELPEILEELARLGAQLLIQAALEAEVTEFVGRERYQRATTCPDANAHALRQRCLIHRLRNILAKIPAGVQTEIRDGYWAIFDTTDLNIALGPRLVELVDKRIATFAAKYSDLYPAAMQILLTDRTGLTAYLRFPVGNHARVRHSNFIERCFGETKRRTKVIGRFPGETSAISLVWAVLDRSSRGWRGLTMTPTSTRMLHDLRRSLLTHPANCGPRRPQPPPPRQTPSPPPRSKLALRRPPVPVKGPLSDSRVAAARPD